MSYLGNCIIKHCQRNRKEIDISQLTGVDGDKALILSLSYGDMIEIFKEENKEQFAEMFIARSLYYESDGVLDRVFDDNEIDAIKNMQYNVVADFYREITKFSAVDKEKN